MDGLRAAIEAEIAWHNSEAQHHGDAEDECIAHEDDEEAELHHYAMRGHDTAAARLRAVLHAVPDPSAAPPDPEIQF